MGYIKPLALGFVGTILAVFILHIYQDHLLIHALVDAFNKAAAAVPAPK